jgi:hypothetical protein
MGEYSDFKGPDCQRRIMVDLEYALKFPTKDREWKRKVLIGGVLNIIPVVNFLSIGYAYRLFRTGMERRYPGLPEWENWGDLFVQGLIVFLIGLIYNLASLLLVLIHPVLGLLSFIAVALLFPAALAQHAMSGNFSQAFQLGEIWTTIQQTRNDYLIAWLVTVGIFLLLTVVGTIPVLGWILAAIVGFYAYLVFAVLFGEICLRSNLLSQRTHDWPAAEE